MKESVKLFWENDVQYYNQSISRELVNENRDIWIDLINKFKPIKDNPSILDIGTGPGFIPLILSKEGYENIYGIDVSDKMISMAKNNASISGYKINFQTMDIHQMNFSDESFDLIICRRVIWTLNNPIEAYRECFRILKPHGRIIIFDGNYYSYLFSPEIAQIRLQDHQSALKNKISINTRGNHVEAEAIAQKLPLSNITRPDWDLRALIDSGFSQIIIDPDLISHFNDQSARLIWGYAKQFIVIAEK